VGDNNNNNNRSKKQSSQAGCDFSFERKNTIRIIVASLQATITPHLTAPSVLF